MGGIGSGSGQWHGARKVVESVATQVDVRRLHREGKLQPGTELETWAFFLLDRHRESGRAWVGEECVTFCFRWNAFAQLWKDVTEEVPLVWTRCHYGSRRPWFLCPGPEEQRCGRRAAILFGTPEEPRLLCRTCCGLAYDSQRETPDCRALHRARKIRQRLGPLLSNWQHPFPEKPKRMHWSTYERLAEAALKDEEAGLAALVGRFELWRRQRTKATAWCERRLQELQQEKAQGVGRHEASSYWGGEAGGS